MATSPGGLGGLRGLSHLREILTGIGVLVIPEQKAVPASMNVFSDAGALTDEGQKEAIVAIGARTGYRYRQTYGLTPSTCADSLNQDYPYCDPAAMNGPDAEKRYQTLTKSRSRVLPMEKLQFFELNLVDFLNPQKAHSFVRLL